MRYMLQIFITFSIINKCKLYKFNKIKFNYYVDEIKMNNRLYLSLKFNSIKVEYTVYNPTVALSLSLSLSSTSLDVVGSA